jgi:poly-gamma-glutamate biosynthesis protein PgsC/CapC
MPRTREGVNDVGIIFDTQTTRIAIVVGIVISMLWYEKRNLSPGGVIVPGLVSLFLITKPLVIVYTLIVAFITCLTVKKLSDHVILFGRRRFSALMLISFGFAWLLELLTNSMAGMGAEWQVIGFIIPGLIANEMERQGYFETLYTLATISTVTLLLLFVLIGWTW